MKKAINDAFSATIYEPSAVDGGVHSGECPASFLHCFNDPGPDLQRHLFAVLDDEGVFVAFFAQPHVALGKGVLQVPVVGERHPTVRRPVEKTQFGRVRLEEICGGGGVIWG